MSSAKKQIDFLRFANCCNKQQRQQLLKTITKDQILALCECADNTLAGNVPLSTKQKKLLTKQKAWLRQLASHKIGIKKKRKTLSQKGGSLPLLLAPVLAALISHFTK